MTSDSLVLSRTIKDPTMLQQWHICHWLQYHARSKLFKRQRLATTSAQCLRWNHQIKNTLLLHICVCGFAVVLQQLPSDVMSSPRLLKSINGIEAIIGSDLWHSNRRLAKSDLIAQYVTGAIQQAKRKSPNGYFGKVPCIQAWTSYMCVSSMGQL